MLDAGQSSVHQASSPASVFNLLSPSVFVVESLDAKGTAIAFGSGVSIALDEVVTNKQC
jgi:hypothetical protein